MLQIEKDEAREMGFIGAAIAEQNRLVTSLIDTSNIDLDEIELLSGPPAPKVYRQMDEFDIEDSINLVHGDEYGAVLSYKQDKEQPHLTDDRILTPEQNELYNWYTYRVMDLLALCDLLMKGYYRSSNGLLVKEALEIKIKAADLDNRMEFQGMPFTANTPTTYELLCKYGKMQKIEKAVRDSCHMRVLRHEVEQRAAYLQRIGYLVEEKEVTQ